MSRQSFKRSHQKMFDRGTPANIFNLRDDAVDELKRTSLDTQSSHRSPMSKVMSESEKMKTVLSHLSSKKDKSAKEMRIMKSLSRKLKL